MEKFFKKNILLHENSNTKMNKLFFLLPIASVVLSCGSRIPNEPVLEPVYDTRKDPEVPNSEGVVNIGKYRISDKAASVLNQLFTTNDSNNEVVIIVKNDSNCDFIMGIKGSNKSYSLPVSSQKEETIVVEKGDYELTTEICNSAYLSKRHLVENTKIVLKHTFVAVKNE